MSTYDPAAYYEWLDRMAERNEPERLHAEGECGEDCPVCGQEDREYDQWRDDATLDAASTRRSMNETGG
jgi:hypothetical protein